jgi:hypothetical protein
MLHRSATSPFLVCSGAFVGVLNVEVVWDDELGLPARRLADCSTDVGAAGAGRFGVRSSGRLSDLGRSSLSIGAGD